MHLRGHLCRALSTLVLEILFGRRSRSRRGVHDGEILANIGVFMLFMEAMAMIGGVPAGRGGYSGGAVFPS